jgi:hypothetical protein
MRGLSFHGGTVPSWFFEWAHGLLAPTLNVPSAPTVRNHVTAVLKALNVDHDHPLAARRIGDFGQRGVRWFRRGVWLGYRSR